MPRKIEDAKPEPTTVSASRLGVDYDLGSFFLDEDEKDQAIENATEFFVTKIDYDEENQYGPRYVLTLHEPDDERNPRGWSIAATNARRNAIIEEIAKQMSLMNAKSVGPIVFERRGRTVMFRPVEQEPTVPASNGSENLPF